MMDPKGDMRFQNGSSESYFDLEQQCYSTNTVRKTSRSSVMISSVRRRFGMKRLKGQLEGKPGRRKLVLDPQGPFLQLWNRIFAVSCVIAVSLDPLFFYIPVTDNNRKCLDLDNKLKFIICFIRSLTDLFYIFHVILQFRTGYSAPSSRVFSRGEFIEDSWAIAKRYLCSYFIVDIFSVLPLPQVVILIIAPRVNASASSITRKLLMIAIFSQYVPRLGQLFRLYKGVTRDSRIFSDSTPWAGAAFNLFLYMLASNVLGAFWYLLTIERVDACWREACANHHCNSHVMYCGVPRTGNYSFLNSSCLFLESNEIKEPTDFNFGIFLEALQAKVVEKPKFWHKFFYCFWWGLRNLSSLGQNLRTSDFIWENLYAIFISIIGLVLFALLIGNMQKYLQSIDVRIDEMRKKRRDRRQLEKWMSHRNVPENLRCRIKKYQQYKWQGTRGIEEDALIKNLPKDLRRDITRHHWDILVRVPLFAEMDDKFMDALSDRLKPVLYTEQSYICREGDPVDEMLFLRQGRLISMTTNGGRTGYFNSVNLQVGDFCGEELLTWALDSKSSSILPNSTRTIQAVTDVEAFALNPDDLRFVASQFRQFHSKKLQHTFRFYSQQWRTRAACIIQAAWRRHIRKKLQKSLQEEEHRLQAALAEGGNSTSHGTTMHAS